MLNLPVFVVDFEGTTRSGVVEYGVVKTENGAIVEAWSAFCQPSGRVAADEFRTHRLSESFLKSREPFHAAYGDFSEMRSLGVLAAHHHSTEDRLLRHHWPIPPAVHDPLRPGSFCHRWGPYVDTLSLAQSCWPNLPAFDLKTVTQDLGLEDELRRRAAEASPPGRRDWHCALFDALASALILLRVVEASPGMGLLDLLRISGYHPPQPELF